MFHQTAAVEGGPAGRMDLLFRKACHSPAMLSHSPPEGHVKFPFSSPYSEGYLSRASSIHFAPDDMPFTYRERHSKQK
ncbi:hypothetical protein Baya_1564 [Bagarius yarrelli]|uniref:Uncharacterized protein n=1 Tax=Bagarius yarrelli TaxID=175774 RepID=A0A556TLJ4_BAGYA|nr:hypothetical protein Baya_1564 [Bagarius yarrelli]